MKLVFFKIITIILEFRIPYKLLKPLLCTKPILKLV